jgi:hypothetical protein
VVLIHSILCNPYANEIFSLNMAQLQRVLFFELNS